jgi:hypothetical protein
VLTLTGYLSRGKALTHSDQGLLLLVGDCTIRQRVLWEKDSGWLVLSGLNPEILWSLWLMASATWWEITSAEGLHDWGRRAVPLFKLYPGICLTTEEKHGKPQSGLPSSCKLLVAPTWMTFNRQPRLACWTSVHHHYAQVTLVSPWSAQMPSNLPN